MIAAVHGLAERRLADVDQVDAIARRRELVEVVDRLVVVDEFVSAPTGNPKTDSGVGIDLVRSRRLCARRLRAGPWRAINSAGGSVAGDMRAPQSWSCGECSKMSRWLRSHQTMRAVVASIARASATCDRNDHVAVRFLTLSGVHLVASFAMRADADASPHRMCRLSRSRAPFAVAMLDSVLLHVIAR